MQQVTAAQQALANADPVEVLRWTVDTLGPRIAFTTGLGVEGCVLIDVIAKHRLPIEIVTIDTGLLFEETYAFWHQLEHYYDVKIGSIEPRQSVVEQAHEHGAELWTRAPSQCCALRKVAPLAEALGGYRAWVTAIRREQTADRRSAQVVEWDERFKLVKVNPLVGWSNEQVWSYVRGNRVPYHPLHERGYPSLGCRPCTSPVQAGEDPRAGRWRGHNKTECGLHIKERTG